MKIDEVFGLPAHPLFVHIPIVLIPLAALSMLIMAVVPRTRPRLGWPTVAVAGAAVFFAWMAKGSGAKLALRVDPDPKLTHHIALGNTMYLIALVFFVLVTAFVVVDSRARARAGADGSDQPRRAAHGPALVVLAVLAVVSGAAATARIVQVGHAGSRVTWGDVGAPRPAKKK